MGDDESRSDLNRGGLEAGEPSGLVATKRHPARMVLRTRTFTFNVVQEQYDWSNLIASQNPPSSGEQYLYGTCEETYPSCIDRDAHRVEKAFGVRSKPFQRTVSDEVGNNSPQHIRTKQAICKAMQQLVALVDSSREDLATSELSSYIHDRFRAIRQEMELQHIRSLLTAKLLEPMIRLTAIKAHEMCQDRDYSAALVMDRKELAKMFVSLKALYTAHREAGQKLSTEAEFTCYLILFKAEQDRQTAQRDGLAVLLLSTPEDILSSCAVRWALAVVDAIQLRNYVQFVKLLQVATYVQACFLHMLFLEEARESRMVDMTQAFKLKGALLTQLKDMMLLDSVEQVFTWISMRDDQDVQISEDQTQALLPAHPRPQNRAQLVSENFLRKRNGSSTSSIMMSALTTDSLGMARAVASPIAPMFSFPSPQKQNLSPSPMRPDLSSPQESPLLRQQGHIQPVEKVVEPDLARAASEHQAAKQPLVSEHVVAEQAAAEKAAMDQVAKENAAAEQEAEKKAAALRKEAEEREAAMRAAAEQAAREAAAAAAAEEKRRAAEEAKRLEALRVQDEAFRRAGQNLEERERQAWAIAEQDYASDVAVTRQLRKRYREHLAHIDAEEQAASQAQQDAEKREIVQACSRHLPPSVAWRNIHRQERKDQQQAAGLKNVLVAEMAFSRLQLNGEPGGRKGAAGSMVSPVGGVYADCGSTGWQLTPPNVGAISALPSAPRLPDSQPVLQRAKVGSTQCEQLVDSTRSSARLYLTEIQPERGEAIESTDIPIVSRLRSLLSAKSAV